MHGNMPAETSTKGVTHELSRRRDFGFYPTDADAYELIEVVGEGATATVGLLRFCLKLHQTCVWCALGMA